MTLEEHVDNICNWKHNAGLRNAVLEEMRAAVEEEREECAKICDERSEGDQEWYMQLFAASIAEDIRARSTASSAPQAD